MSDAGNFAETEIADYLGGNGAPSAITNVWLKLHLGAPGETGTANAAVETTRKEATYGAASSGVASLDATVSWTDVSTTENITHVSAWDASTAGNHLFNGTLDSTVELTAGDDFDLTDHTITVA
jgi:hypothetical protein